MPYIEIKTKKQITLQDARDITKKGCVSAVLTTGLITKKAKQEFDEHDIAYAENVPENEFMESEAQEEG